MKFSRLTKPNGNRQDELLRKKDMEIQIRKAERKRAKARIGLCAPSGGGKTHSALRMASGMGKKVVLIDTENGSGELESGKPNIPDYDVITITAPFTVEKYLQAIHAAEKYGADVIIIDSLTHAWAGAGGLLDEQAKIAKQTKNSYTAWRDVTPLHNELIETILQSPAHVIGTMRTKTDYALVENDRGKQVPQKIGLAPIQREGMDYEFTIVFDIDQATHRTTVSKDRTSLFDGKPGFVITDETGKAIAEWLSSGTAATEQHKPTTAPAAAPQQAAPAARWSDTDEGRDLVRAFRDMVRAAKLTDAEQETWLGSLMKSATLDDAKVARQRAFDKLAARSGLSNLQRVTAKLREQYPDVHCTDAKMLISMASGNKYETLDHLIIATEDELVEMLNYLSKFGANAA